MKKKTKAFAEWWNRCERDLGQLEYWQQCRLENIAWRAWQAGRRNLKGKKK